VQSDVQISSSHLLTQVP